MPSVSILLPVYNGARFLPECLASIRAQTLEAWELVAVDDGSTDGTPGLLAEAAKLEARIHVLPIPHGGIVAALNAGLRACTAPLIARMDTDDRMAPTRLARQTEWLAKYPDQDLVGSHIAPLPLDGPSRPGLRRYSAWLNSHKTSDDLKRSLFVESPLAHSTFLARRELFAGLGGYREVSWPEDYDFLLRAAASGARLGIVPEVLLERGDWAGRLTRTDALYSVDGMDRGRLHHLVNGPWRTGRRVAVLGDGDIASRIHVGLAEDGVEAIGPVNWLPAPFAGALGTSLAAHPEHHDWDPDQCGATPGSLRSSRAGPNILLRARPTNSVQGSGQENGIFPEGSMRPRDWLLLLCYRNRNHNLKAAEALAPGGWRDGIDVLRLR